MDATKAQQTLQDIINRCQAAKVPTFLGLDIRDRLDEIEAIAEAGLANLELSNPQPLETQS